MDLRRDESRALSFAFAINLIFFLVELVGGFTTQSLALLSDAAHMFSDVFALGLGFFALKMAGRAKDLSKTFGYARAEILAALINTVILWVVAFGLVIEALMRFSHPSPVSTSPMMGIAALGLLANILSVLWLRPHSHSHSHGHAHADGHSHDDSDHHSQGGSARHNLNIRAAYLHLMMDIFGSLVALVAGLLMHYTHIWIIDGLASIVILALTIISSWRLLRESIEILMEATPRHLSITKILNEIKALKHIKDVHDLHVWHLTPQEGPLLTTHVVLSESLPLEHYQDFLKSLKSLLREKFQITHSTIQVEYNKTLEEDCVACD